MKRILFAIVLLLSSAALCFAGERDGYTLEEMVVLSRHNIRSPLSGGGSVLSRITPCEWFEWTSAPGELSLKGAVLETQMGQYFSSWAESEGLFGRNAVPLDEEVLFYANSLQRTIATAQYFSSGMFPLANVRIRHDKTIGVMDPIFNPQITCADERFLSEAYSQIEAFGGEKGLRGIGEKMAPNYAVLEKVLRMSKSPAAANDTVRVPLHDTSVKLTPGKEP
jgi:glucose-1-phosphatase